ncbi:PaeR7I family type II restriction endonuclease [Rubrobacter indicoceani]|uniref:PaeR7I family type II restriction endonuclease n=1 Tax=Rubrobacter indicoceani TaxID=2051957 RepID=UPI000E5B5BB0|nr:PaeR7I family type II restriction endonuclease [Rubrobacter indicoceani]
MPGRKSESGSYSERLEEALKKVYSSEQSVRADRHLRAVGDLVREIFVEAGFNEENVLTRSAEEGEKRLRERSGARLTLPGYYRVTKDWDLVAFEDDNLVAAVEFKSVSTSAAKNVNNRVEEALGSAFDLRSAYSQKLLEPTEPWLGYMVILQGTEELYKIRKPKRTLFSSNKKLGWDKEFEDASYLKRYAILCKRLIQSKPHQLYDAACLLVVKEIGNEPLVEEPDPKLGFEQFVNKVKDRASSRPSTGP